jgi:hypothetical protein
VAASAPCVYPLTVPSAGTRRPRTASRASAHAESKGSPASRELHMRSRNSARAPSAGLGMAVNLRLAWLRAQRADIAGGDLRFPSTARLMLSRVSTREFLLGLGPSVVALAALAFAWAQQPVASSTSAS